MLRENIAPAKAKLSSLVNQALAGEDVVLCKDGVPVVRLVPVRAVVQSDPCRTIVELSVIVGNTAQEPLSQDDWGTLEP